MKKILIGLLFIFFDFVIEYEGLNVGILPDFIGYALLALGIRDLLKKWDSSDLRLASILSIMAVAITAIQYLFDLVALDLEMIGTLWNALCIALLLGTTFLLTQGLREIERLSSWDLSGSRLRQSWLLMALVQLLAYVLPLIWLEEILDMVLLVAALVCNVLFLLVFCRCQQVYDGGGQSR